MSAEKWMPVVGYEGLYEVSDRGRIRSLDRIVERGNRPMRLRGKVLKPQPSSRAAGYHIILCDDSGHTLVRVHQIVMSAFVGPRPEGLMVLHWDDDPSHNALSNLRYGTQFDNMRDCVRNGHHRKASQTHCKHGHEFTPDNIYGIKGRPGNRHCKQCTKDHAAKRKTRIRQERIA